jgi:sirohydrochlorin cobaltochelatase
MKKGILAASFGTTHIQAMEKSIAALENDMAATYPDYAVMRAFTSGMVIKALKKRDVNVRDVPGALEELISRGVGTLIVQPTHIMPGFEYEKLIDAVNTYRTHFDRVTLSTPLIRSISDMEALVSIIDHAFPRPDGEGLILMGHGTAHFAGCIYPALSFVLREQGFADILVGTVEGYPTLESVIKRTQALGLKSAVLAPLMLAAGDHAQNDMAGDGPESWKNRLETRGIKVRCDMRGLGEHKAVRDLYLSHLAHAIKTSL